MRVLSVFGTRPEAIKMASVVRALAAAPGVESKVCVTGQHRQMLDQVLRTFRIVPDVDLAAMTPGQDLADLTATLLLGLRKVLRQHRPDAVVVQGDTTTTFVASLAAFYERVPVAHVEAGLRTGDLQAPWPEEANRRLTSILARWHFAPTEQARENLLREGVPADRIAVTGNTVIDALHQACAILDVDAGLRDELARRFGFLDRRRRLVLVTGHRRESFGDAFRSVCLALKDIVEARDDVEVVFPVHLNPQVREPAERLLAGVPRIHLIEPQDYLPFLHLLRRAHLVITDSGGIQEEAPALGKPVLVTRDVTERPEAVAAGTAKVVGTDRAGIAATALELLQGGPAYERMAQARNPYGDGQAATRIVDRLLKDLAGASTATGP